VCRGGGIGEREEGRGKGKKKEKVVGRENEVSRRKARGQRVENKRK